MRAALAVLLLIAIGASASAQEDPAALHVQATAAAAEGRMDEAIALAEQALAVAEAKNGDHRDTGLLAINLALLLFTEGRDAAALAPASRALGLAEEGLLEGDLEPAEGELFVAVAELAANGGQRAARRLRRMLEDGELETTAYRDVYALAWVRLLETLRADERWLPLMELAGEARVRIAGFGEDYAPYVVQIARLEAQAARRQGAYFRASIAYGWAAYAYQVGAPEQTNAANDPDYARLVALEAAMWGIYADRSDAMQPRDREIGARTIEHDGGRLPLLKPRSTEEPPPVVEGANCFEWPADRASPDFPRDEARAGNFGVVVVGYDIERDGAVRNVRIMATSPERLSDEFAAAIHAAAASWRAEVLPGASDECLADNTTIVQFMFE